MWGANRNKGTGAVDKEMLGTKIPGKAILST